MTAKRALAHLTVLELTPPEVVEAGIYAGFDAVGLRLHPVRPDDVLFPMHGDTPMMRETLSRLNDSAVEILDIEVMRLVGTKNAEDFLPTFEAAQRLGAKRILTLIDERDDALSVALLARAAELAAPFGLTLALEFMPWFGVSNLTQAAAIVAGARQPNTGLLLDSLHLSRSGGSPADIAAIPPEMISYAQICDAPARLPPTLDDIAHEAKFARLLPGEGGLPLVDYLAALPRDLPISVEAPLAGAAGALPGRERAKLAFDSMAAVMARSGEMAPR